MCIGLAKASLVTLFFPFPIQVIRYTHPASLLTKVWVLFIDVLALTLEEMRLVFVNARVPIVSI